MKRSGFTLMELSIVIIIIALLAGGAVIGKSLIRTSQLQALLTQYDSYVQSIQQFRDKYHALPGDMSNATDIWNTLDASCPSYTSYDTITLPYSPKTCNGDGDGRIGFRYSDLGTCSGVASFRLCPYESFLSWQHLSNASLIDNRYTGKTNATNTVSIGNNVPESSVKGLPWHLLYFPPPSAISLTNNLFDDTYGHVLTLNAENVLNLSIPDSDFLLSPNDMLVIDSKIDDGFPGTGKIRNWRDTNCIENNTSQTAARYIDDSKALTCSPIFLTGF